MGSVLGAGFKVIKKVTLITTKHLHNSYVGVFMYTYKTHLQDSACRASIGCLSQWVKL